MKRVIKAVQSHRRTAGFVLAALALAAAGVFVLPKFISADGQLNNSFGTNGVVTSNPASGGDTIYDMAVDATYLYAVGQDAGGTGGRSEWRIEKRRLSDGALCTIANCGTEFGTGGVIAFQPNPSTTGSEYIDDIALDAVNGFMYVIGSSDDPTYDWEWRIEKRYLNNGALVTTFGNNGVVTTSISLRSEYASGITLDATGQYIYAAGSDLTVSASKKRLRIEKRRVSDGALCTAANCGTEFGTGGVKIDYTQSYTGAYAGTIEELAADSNGLYTVGWEYVGGNPPYIYYRWRIEKRDLNTGVLNWSRYVSNSSGSNVCNEYGYDIATDSSGIYVIGNSQSNCGTGQWQIAKLDFSGNPVSSFGSSGIASYIPSGGGTEPKDIFVDSTGLYVAGYDSAPGDWQWRVDKRSATDGSSIWTRTSNPSSSIDYANAVVVDSTGQLYAGGVDLSLGNGEWRIEGRRTEAPVTAPTVTTQSAGSVGDSSAVLNGLANPNNGATTGWFRYDAAPPGSCNDTFGTRLPLSGGTSLGSGSTAVSFFQTVGGLNSSATYYFCAIAENSAGKSYGSILSFATTAPGAVSSYGVTREGCELKNWGWGSEVTGWVSFNSTNNYGGKTPGSNYGATLANFCQNAAPNAPGNLAVTDTSSANWSFNCVSPLQPAFSWTFSDPNTDDYQSAFQLQVDDNSDFSSPEYDSGSATTTSFTTSVPAGRLSYNTTYNWRVKTWDNRKTPLVSPWATGTPFATTAHSWPSPDFTFLPNSPSVGQDTLFRRDQDSDGDTFGTRCFDSGNNAVSCGNYYWTMEDTSPTMSETASSSIPVIVSFNSPGRKEINLKATDAEGFYCLKSRSTGTVTLPLPQYKEVLPR